MRNIIIFMFIRLNDCIHITCFTYFSHSIVAKFHGKLVKLIKRHRNFMVDALQPENLIKNTPKMKISV